MIFTENGMHISRNHIDLKWTDASFEPRTQPVSSFAKSQHAPPKVPNTNVKCTDKAKLILKRVEVSLISLTACIPHVVVIFQSLPEGLLLKCNFCMIKHMF